MFPLAVVGLLVIGCAEDDTSDGDEVSFLCGGHGELHGNHCHCDPGYELGASDTVCVPEATGDAPGSEPSGGGGAPEPPPAQVDGWLDMDPDPLRARVLEEADGSRVWYVEAISGAAKLTLENAETFGGPTSPGTYVLSEAETSMETCGACLILRTGCATFNFEARCQHVFMPRAGGTIRLEQIDGEPGGRLVGSLEGIAFQEVSIAPDFTTVPVADGGVITLPSWSFDLALQSFDESNEECGGHGVLHGDHCDCDPGYRTDPFNPLQCVPA